jgi:asparaginyl-tRNA synthetase
MSAFSHTLTSVLFSDSSYIGQVVTVGGWLTSARIGKKVGFLVLSDGSSQEPLQVVISEALMETYPALRTLGSGYSIEATGQLIKSQGKGQALELQASSVTIVGTVEDPETYPIQPKKHSPEFLRSLPHLRPRVSYFGAVARLRHAVAMAIHEFMSMHDFLWVATPIISTSDTEGAGQQFRVTTLPLGGDGLTDGKAKIKDDFFGKDAFLTVSGQLDVEAYCMALSRVYTFGPTFRAERSHTTRHLAEFWMVEPEMAFADLTDIAYLAETMLKHVVSYCLEKIPKEMIFFEQEGGRSMAYWQDFIAKDFIRMTYTDAIDFLQKSGESFHYDVSWGMDLQSEHEKFLVDKLGCAVILTDYPKDIKAFYMKASSDGKTVAAMDILVPGMGEIVGGSQREDSLEKLDQRMMELGMDLKEYQFYRDLRKYGSVPHSGFGLGFERLVSYLGGIASIKDAIPYPRVAGSV